MSVHHWAKENCSQNCAWFLSSYGETAEVCFQLVAGSSKGLCQQAALNVGWNSLGFVVRPPVASNGKKMVGMINKETEDGKFSSVLQLDAPVKRPPEACESLVASLLLTKGPELASPIGVANLELYFCPSTMVNRTRNSTWDIACFLPEDTSDYLCGGFYHTPQVQKRSWLPSWTRPSAWRTRLWEDRHQEKCSRERSTASLPGKVTAPVCVEPTPCWEEGPRTLGCRSLSSQHSAIGSSLISSFLNLLSDDNPGTHSIAPNRTQYCCHQSLFHPHSGDTDEEEKCPGLWTSSVQPQSKRSKICSLWN